MGIFDLYSEAELREYVGSVFVGDVEGLMDRLRAFYEDATKDRMEIRVGRLEHLLLDDVMSFDYFVYGLLIPFDQVPLYVGTSSEVLLRVIRLRLKLGR